MKHIIGLALFSLIVSATAIFTAFSNVPELVSVPAPAYVPAEKPTKTYCKMRSTPKRYEEESLKLTQAVFDTKAKQLNWELAAPRVSNSEVVLHFFVKSKNGTRYVNSAVAPRAAYDGGALKATSYYKWLADLDSYENLYVTAQYVSERTAAYYHAAETSGKPTTQPTFDAENATSVLLYSGERGYLTEKYLSDGKE